MTVYVEKLLDKGHGFNGNNPNDYYKNLFTLHFDPLSTNPIATIHKVLMWRFEITAPPAMIVSKLWSG